MSVNKEEILEAVSKMSVMDLVDLVSSMEEKFGVSAAVAAAPAVAASSEAPEEEKTSFDVTLDSFGSQKVAVIKVVRTITGLGLKEAKDMVESAPVTVKEGVPKEQAEEIKKQLEEAGADAGVK